MPDGLGPVKRDRVIRITAAQVPGTEYSVLGTSYAVLHLDRFTSIALLRQVPVLSTRYSVPGTRYTVLVFAQTHA